MRNCWAWGCAAIFELTLSNDFFVYSGRNCCTRACIFGLLIVTLGSNSLSWALLTEAVGSDHTLLRLLEVYLAAPCGQQQSILFVLTCYVCMRRWMSQHDTTKLVLLLKAIAGC